MVSDPMIEAARAFDAEPSGSMATVSATAVRALEWLEIGGPVVIILLAMSVMAVTIVLVKLWQFGAVRLGDLRAAREALQLYRSGEASRALALLSGNSINPAAQLLARAIRGRSRGISAELVREEILRCGGDALESLRAGFRPLEVIASLAPLLGLFGTVLGMIEAFHQLELAGNRVDPAVLSGGIWKALVTTAVGLGVAIPIVAMLNWLERRVERLAHEMSSLVTRVFTVDLSEEPMKVNDAPSHHHASAELAGY